MATTIAVPQLDRRLFTPEEVQRMLEARILTEDEPIELIDGELVRMSPQGEDHGYVLSLLNRLLTGAYPEPFGIAPQTTIDAGTNTLLDPDFVVTPTLARRHAKVAEALLIIEVADSSLAFDRTFKAGRYAREGARCYWVVDLVHRCVIVHQGPRPDGTFGSVREVFSGDLELPEAGARLTVEEIMTGL